MPGRRSAGELRRHLNTAPASPLHWLRLIEGNSMSRTRTGALIAAVALSVLAFLAGRVSSVDQAGLPLSDSSAERPAAEEVVV